MGANGENQPNASAQPQQQPEKKKGVLGKIFGIFGGSKEPDNKPDKPQQ
jgi:hypothetical protein